MKRLVETRGFLRKKWFVLSGLLRSQARILEQKLNHMKINRFTMREQDGIWYTFYGKIQ
jgi:ribosomal protein L11 methyltransferase